MLWKLGVQSIVCHCKRCQSNGDLSSSFPCKYLSIRIKQSDGWGEGIVQPQTFTHGIFCCIRHIHCKFTTLSLHPTDLGKKNAVYQTHADHYSLILVGIAGSALIKEGEYISAWDFLARSTDDLTPKRGRIFIIQGTELNECNEDWAGQTKSKNCPRRMPRRHLVPWSSKRETRWVTSSDFQVNLLL